MPLPLPVCWGASGGVSRRSAAPGADRRGQGRAERRLRAPAWPRLLPQLPAGRARPATASGSSRYGGTAACGLRVFNSAQGTALALAALPPPRVPRARLPEAPTGSRLVPAARQRPRRPRRLPRRPQRRPRLRRAPRRPNQERRRRRSAPGAGPGRAAESPTCAARPALPCPAAHPPPPLPHLPQLLLDLASFKDDGAPHRIFYRLHLRIHGLQRQDLLPARLLVDLHRGGLGSAAPAHRPLPRRPREPGTRRLPIRRQRSGAAQSHVFPPASADPRPLAAQACRSLPGNPAKSMHAASDSSQSKGERYQR